MNPTRFKILIGTAAVLLVALIVKWISGWGLVTIHENDAPISEIIRSIERQGGIALVSNADPSTPVTMHVDRVPPAEAVSLLADWLDANWSVTYVVAGDKGTVKAAVDSFASGQRNEGFRSFRARGGGDMMLGEVTIDPRKVEWNVSPSESGELQSYLSQFTQKTGASATVPEDWNPVVASAPKSGKASSAVHGLVKSVGGAVEEVFVVRVSDDDSSPGGPPSMASSGRPMDGNGGNWGGGGSNPEWEAERIEAQLAQLPAAQQQQVRAEMDERQAFWDRVRSLPEDERRAEMERMFNDPVVQDRMLEREAEREARRSPERRADRLRRYIERKEEIRQQQQAQQS